MVNIEIKPSVYTNVPPILVLHAKQELERVIEAREKKPRAKKKWLEILIVDGHKLGLGCHMIGDTIWVSKIETMKGKKKKYNVK